MKKTIIHLFESIAINKVTMKDVVAVVVTTKVQAGALVTSAAPLNPKSTIRENLYAIATGYKKNALLSIAVVTAKGEAIKVLSTKGGAIFSVDKAIAEQLTVGDLHCMHGSAFDKYPNIMAYWTKLGAKTWSDKAFDLNAHDAKTKIGGYISF